MYPKVKRVLDVCCALLLLCFTLPVMVVAWIFIRIDSKGPALFTQERPGKSGVVFKIYKFRTMRVETMTKRGRPLTDVQRITPVGKIIRKMSIDELPQLFNVLKGDMSFIGPRPLLVQYLPLYSKQQSHRHDVLPGITGWAQVNGRNAISWEEKFRYDVWYVRHMSFWLDFRIVVMTFQNILAKKDINSSDDVTMEVFTGNVSKNN